MMYTLNMQNVDLSVLYWKCTQCCSHCLSQEVAGITVGAGNLQHPRGGPPLGGGGKKKIYKDHLSMLLNEYLTAYFY